MTMSMRMCLATIDKNGYEIFCHITNSSHLVYIFKNGVKRHIFGGLI